jgi:hypothetical protein
MSCCNSGKAPQIGKIPLGEFITMGALKHKNQLTLEDEENSCCDIHKQMLPDQYEYEMKNIGMW